jgi:PAS domain S-box-containing protein
MRELAGDLLSSDFMPHGHCYLWDPLLVGTEVVTNLSIGLAHLSISISLVWLVRAIRDLPFQLLYVAFGVFIVACGFTHFLDVWVIWRPNYWVDASVRIVTAAASVGTAVLVFRRLPEAVALAGAARLAHGRGVELARINEELEALYAKTRETLAEAIPQLVWTAAPDGQVEYLNQRWFDYTGERAIGSGWTAALHPDDAPRVTVAWSESQASGEPYEMEYRLRRRDGAYRWFLARGLPLRVGGRIVKWFGTCTDVHDQKLAAEERELLLARAREDVRARDAFLTIAAHELRTPLTPLRLQVDRLFRAAREGRLDRLTPERLAAALGVIERQIDRQQRLVADLLDVGRIITRRFELDREELDLGALVGEAVDRRRADLARAGCEIAVHLAPGVAGRFDRRRLDHVVSHLLSNAVAYAPGEPVTVDLSDEPGGVTLVVGDHGPGIAPDDLARIFERFARATSDRHGGGLGLGLWLVQQIVEAHGGTVAVESVPARGCRFTVRLPRA